MRTLALPLLSVVLAFPTCAFAQHHPEPPGYIQGRQKEQQMQRYLDASLPRVQPNNNLAQAREDAQELQKLTQQVLPELQKLNQGLLAKELGKQLKEMEKLSKRLRGDLDLH